MEVDATRETTNRIEKDRYVINPVFLPMVPNNC
jgi:hypothetical protein